MNRIRKEKVVNDSVHGLIHLPDYIIILVDTIEFQRLRWTWQLGLCPFVYPTANHTRFEHCIGTFCLASKFIRKIQRQQLEYINPDDEGAITDAEVKCVEIAALYHDIGHGPFSHFWDHQIIPKFCDNPIAHEKQFEKMWEIVLSNNPQVKETLEEHGITEIHYPLINRLVQGTYLPDDKHILFYFVSNPFSGFDVDKWDYIARDSLNLGYSTNSFPKDIERLIEFSRPMRTDGNQWTVGFREKEIINVQNVFILRYKLHKKAYHHRVIKSIELMMIDGFKYCREHKLITNSLEFNEPQWILQNNDTLFWNLMQTHDIPQFRNILRRQLYRCPYVFDSIKTEQKLEEIKQTLEKFQGPYVAVSESKFQLGNDEKNPLTKIKFYSKAQENPVIYNKDTIPDYLNLKWNDFSLYIFEINENKQLFDNIKCHLEHLESKGMGNLITYK